MDSSLLTPQRAFNIWLEHNERDLHWHQDDVELAFKAGYALAQSQSTQGAGEWDPEEDYR